MDYQLKLIHKIKLVLIQLAKGGDNMKAARDIMVDTMRDLREGKCPQKVADIVHKNGHSIAQNQFAEVKAFKTMGDIETAQALQRAQENIEQM